MARQTSSFPRLGIIGLGAFGRFMARHLAPHFDIVAYDPAAAGEAHGVRFADLASVARSPLLVLAVPVGRLEETVEAIRPHVVPGALVLDVGSVKVVPARIMRRGLPESVGIVATHPLFGPQSGRDGIAGLKVAVCPVRGDGAPRVAAFLRKALGLKVIVTTPDEHDRELAMAQGLTHLIAKVLVEMEPLPQRMTTRSFDLIMQAVGMVRDDAPGVFEAIERLNPYAPQTRRRFFSLAAALEAALEPTPRQPPARLPAAAARSA